ncbi:MAG: hypothetical protein AAGF30_14340 [Pseudomonadota bacterium]
MTDAPCRVWWFEGFWEEDRYRAPIVPYVASEPELKEVFQFVINAVPNRDARFTATHQPSCLFIKDSEWGDRRDFDDLGPMHSAGIFISGAMIDLLSNFDLGDTQILELPLYEGIADPRNKLLGNREPDLSRPVPGRWGLLHVLAKKAALYDEGCEGIDFRVRKHWLEHPPLMASVPYRSKKTVLALNAEAACTGPDLWFDERIDDVPFISDRLRLAIEEAGLRVPTMKWLKEAKLV